MEDAASSIHALVVVARRSDSQETSWGTVKQNRLTSNSRTLYSCRANYPLEIEASLNPTQRRKHLTREACNKCELLFEARNCSWYTQFLTTFLLFFTASAPSQSMTYLKFPLFAFQSKSRHVGKPNPTNQWGGKRGRGGGAAPSLSAQQDSSDKRRQPEDSSMNRCTT